MDCRVLTYNVHGCKGTDGKVSPERTAKVIAQYEPDIVALQELDLGRVRSGEIDQPHLIAKYLGMMHHFHATIRVEEEQYGNAILSRYPARLKKASKLPNASGIKGAEPRGAIWVSVEINNMEIQIINTHLGLRKKERLFQVEELLGKNWLSHPDCKQPIIFCGDFNARASSRVCHKISHVLKDVQSAKENHKPKATWTSQFPFFRIDHIYVSSDIKVTGVDVPRTKLNKLSSDHLPLLADLNVLQTVNRS